MTDGIPRPQVYPDLGIVLARRVRQEGYRISLTHLVQVLVPTGEH